MNVLKKRGKKDPAEIKLLLIAIFSAMFRHDFRYTIWHAIYKCLEHSSTNIISDFNHGSLQFCCRFKLLTIGICSSTDDTLHIFCWLKSKKRQVIPWHSLYYSEIILKLLLHEGYKSLQISGVYILSYGSKGEKVCLNARFSGVGESLSPGTKLVTSDSQSNTWKFGWW